MILDGVYFGWILLLSALLLASFVSLEFLFSTLAFKAGGLRPGLSLADRAGLLAD